MQIFRLSTVRMKINQIPYVIFQATSFPLNFASPFSVVTHNRPEIFQLKHYILWTKAALNVQFFRFLNALMKVHLPNLDPSTQKSQKLTH